MKRSMVVWKTVIEDVPVIKKNFANIMEKMYEK